MCIYLYLHPSSNPTARLHSTDQRTTGTGAILIDFLELIETTAVQDDPWKISLPMEFTTSIISGNKKQTQS